MSARGSAEEPVDLRASCRAAARKILHEDRQHRDDHAESQHVDEHGDEDQRGALSRWRLDSMSMRGQNSGISRVRILPWGRFNCDPRPSSLHPPRAQSLMKPHPYMRHLYLA